VTHRSISVVTTGLQDEHVQRFSDRSRLSRIELSFQAPVEAAEGISRNRVFPRSRIHGQMVVLYESHVRRPLPPAVYMSSRLARVRSERERISQQLCGHGLCPALADSSWRLNNWPSILSPPRRPIARQGTQDNVMLRSVQTTHSLPVKPEVWRMNRYGFTAVCLYRHPHIGVLQTSVSIERQFSVFPLLSLGHSLRCLSRARRHGAPLLRPYGRPRVSAFRKFLCNERKKIFRTFQKSAAGPWERGTLASLRARVSRGQSGQIQQGEMTWHSTKTKSL
jgi:hypothetical protein